MIAGHYDVDLIDTIYVDVYFTIDGEQFPEDALPAHECDSRIHEEYDAVEKAKELANRFNCAVEVAVYGTWGTCGNEYIETFKVHPTPCPIQGLRDDLADILAKMDA